MSISKALFPDIILTNGKIITMDENFSIVEAVAIKDGRFTACGKTEEVLETALAGPKTEIIDLAGKTVLPGLIDTHNHLTSTGRLLQALPIVDARSIAEILAVIEERVKTTPKGEWLTGKAEAWEPEYFTEGRLPNRYDLDKVSPDNPVLISAVGVGVANSLALRLAGVTKETPDPPEFEGRIERDKAGEPTGVLYVAAQRLVTQHMPGGQFKDIEISILVAQDAYIKSGLTSIIDPGVGTEAMRAYQNLHMRGELKLRINMMPRRRRLDESQGLGVYTGFGDERLRLGALKLFIDGGVMFRTAYMHKHFEGQERNFGRPSMSQEELDEIVYEAHSCGWSWGIHATGDRGLDMVVNAFASAQEKMPRDDVRHSAIHAYFPTPQTLEKMREFSIIAAVQPRFIHAWGEGLVKRVGLKRAEGFKPLRTYLNSGIRLAGGSDSYVVRYEPFLGIHAALERTSILERLLGAEERLSLKEALRMYTTDAAYLSFEEALKGSIEPGKLADLIVLDRDILSIPTDEIKDIEVEMTVIGGEVVYQK